jgi:hypothetical protein
LFKLCFQFRHEFLEHQDTLKREEDEKPPKEASKTTDEQLSELKTIMTKDDLKCNKNGDFDLNFVFSVLNRLNYTVEHYSFNENKEKVLKGEYNPKEHEKVIGYIMHIGDKILGHYTAIINTKNTALIQSSDKNKFFELDSQEYKPPKYFDTPKQLIEEKFTSDKNFVVQAILKITKK